MKSIYKPILFSTEMVQANLEGRKRMTRRTQGLEIPNQDPENYIFLGWDKNIAVFKSPEEKYRDCKPKFIKGDILWVRETWKKSNEFGEPRYLYKSLWDSYKTGIDLSGWKPSIHMPKAAARIFLEVVNVRCERLHDISESDAIAEGVYQHSDYGSTGYRHYGKPDEALTDIDAVWSFETLWESINGKDSWKVNPWVWVYDFKVIEKPTEWPQ